MSNPLPTNDVGFVFPPKLYDFLKYVAFVVLPAVATLIIGLGLTLHWGAATGVAGVVTLIDAFLGSILGKSSSNFKQQSPAVFGDLIIKQDPEGIPVGMKIIGHHEDFVFQDKGQVVLNVKREQDLQ